MYEHEIPEEILNSFKLSRLIKLGVWFLAIFTLLCGVIISIQLTNWTHFARSGSVLVVLSLSLAAFGFGNGFIDKMLTVLKPIALRIVNMQSENRPYLYGINDGLTDKQRDQLVKKVTSERVNQIHMLMKNRLSKDIQKIEFTIAALGTFVWGFGDLIGKL
jgi:hypothetical protein